MKTLNKVKINGTEQWVLVSGKKADAPLIIHVQAGPGFPMIPEAKAMEKMLSLEQEYTVAYWDQRGCGKSFNESIDPQTVNFKQLADDIIECTKHLLKEYGQQKAILIGYSMGATAGLMAAIKNSQLFAQLFLVGIDIDLPNATVYTQHFMESVAKEIGNAKWVKQANELSTMPML